MAVYVQLSTEVLQGLAQAYGLGPLQSARGIPEGSINSNYFLETDAGRLFLRVSTVRSPADLLFEASLLSHLLESGFPAPHLVPTRAGQPFLEFEGGRATVFRLLPGDELTRAQLTAAHLEQLGRVVGKLHRLGESFQGARLNPYSPEVVGGWLDGLKAEIDAEVRSALPLLHASLARAQTPHPMLPRGPIHADIFLDNVKWVGGRVSALFDFEMACVDAFILDAAITLNAWCFDGDYDPAHCRSFIRGYEMERQLSEAERAGFFDAALFGAVRYTASRIRDFHLSPLPPERLLKKDFRTYLARVQRLNALGNAGFRALIGLD